MIAKFELNIATSAGTDMIDLTGQVRGLIQESSILDGMALVFVPGSTGAVTTIEYESGALSDLAAAIERLAPRDIGYHHDRRWGDGNGYSHVRAALLGPSLSLPVIDGRPALGDWQQIVFIDFDNRPRQRRILVQVWGESDR